MRDVLTADECLTILCQEFNATQRLQAAARLGAERERERAARVCATLPAFQKQHDGSYVPTTPLDCAIAIRRGEGE